MTSIDEYEEQLRAGSRRQSRYNDAFTLIMSASVLVTIFAIGFGMQAEMNCGSPPPMAKAAVEAQGFSDVRVGEWEAFSCGQGDTLSRRFTAKNPAGNRVSGIVCCGMFFKGCTIRW